MRFSNKVLSGVVVLSMFPISVWAQFNEAETKALNDSINESQKMVKSGHAYYRSLACPDGSTPGFKGVMTKKSPYGFIDHYLIECKDGTKGEYDWDGKATEQPAPPVGFRFKTDNELKAFKINGRVTEISVSPNSTIWLTTATGRSYFSNDMGDRWSAGSLKSTAELFSNIDRITFFDKDRAIATGNMNGVMYSTNDGGITWHDSKATLDQAIYTVHATRSGKVWMSGSAGVIVRSTDFGKTWIQTATSFGKDARTMSIFMQNDLYGIAGSHNGNVMKVTKDNWATSQDVKTPKAQGLVAKTPDSIEKVFIVGNMIAANQGNVVYRSELSPVSWVPVGNGEIVDIDYDSDRNLFFLVGKNGTAYTSTDLKDLKKIYGDPITVPFINAKFLNGALYVLGDTNIYRVTPERIVKSRDLPRP